MSRRLGLLLVLGGVAVVLLGILFVALIFRQSLTPAPPATQAPAVTIPVVVTTRGLTIRSLLRQDDVTVINMPVEFAPLGAVSEVEQVVGKITMIQMAPGEIVMGHHLADPTNISGNLAFIIEENQVVMAFPSTDLMSQVDVLQPGDLVDILVSFEVPILPDEASALLGEDAQGGDGEEEDELFTFNALQRATIQAIVVEVTRSGGAAASSGRGTVGGTPEPTPTPAPNEVQAQAILLALTPQDALTLKHLKDAGGIFDIVLRAPTANQIFDLDAVSAEYVKDRFELAPEPTEP